MPSIICSHTLWYTSLQALFQSLAFFFVRVSKMDPFRSSHCRLDIHAVPDMGTGCTGFVLAGYIHLIFAD